MSKWDKRYLDLAYYIAQEWSKDPSTKCGAIISDKQNRIVSTGVNGFASGFLDHSWRWLDREFKYKHVIHAEENALLHAKQDLSECKIYVTAPPCSSCMSKIAQSGIRYVIYSTPTLDYLSRWQESFDNAKQVALECGLEIKEL